jgi:branched-chain amino acid transport system substrate-binding protein
MIAECLEEVIYASNEPIVRQSESGDSMFFVRNGEVKVMLEKHGLVKEVARIGPGNYFGEMALLTGESRTATVIAITDTEVFVLRKEPFSEVLLRNAAIANIIAGKVTKRKAALQSSLSQFSDVIEEPTAVQASLLMKIQVFFSLSHMPER